jgi:hypothetical protein
MVYACHRFPNLSPPRSRRRVLGNLYIARIKSPTSIVSDKTGDQKLGYFDD